MYGPSYNGPEEFAKAVHYVTHCLKDVVFDTLVFRGFSGAVVGPTVALHMNKRWALVRKPGDSAHSDRSIEGQVRGKYVILDDFIETGATIRAIVEAVSEQVIPDEYQFNSDQIITVKGQKPECIGVILYEAGWCDRREDDSKDWEKLVGGLRILNWPAA